MDVDAVILDQLPPHTHTLLTGTRLDKMFSGQAGALPRDADGMCVLCVRVCVFCKRERNRERETYCRTGYCHLLTLLLPTTYVLPTAYSFLCLSRI